MDSFGIVEASQRARAWCPMLETKAQRAVLMAIVMFMRKESYADPAASQLAPIVGMEVNSVRRTLRQLEALGAIVSVGSRPVYDSAGTGRGGKVSQWAVPPAPGGSVGDLSHPRRADHLADSHPRPIDVPTARNGAPTRAGARDSWEVGKLSAPHKCEFEESGPRGRFQVCTVCGGSPAAAARTSELSDQGLRA